MSPELYFLLARAFLAAFVTGAAGFGDALVAISIWLYVLSPQEAVPLIVACGAVMSAYSIWRLRRDLDFSKLPAFAFAGALGVLAGSLAHGLLGAAAAGALAVALLLPDMRRR